MPTKRTCDLLRYFVVIGESHVHSAAEQVVALDGEVHVLLELSDWEQTKGLFCLVGLAC